MVKTGKGLKALIRGRNREIAIGYLDKNTRITI